MSTPVAVLGLGAMGLPMALRLADSGFQVSAFDPAPERAELARAGGITVHDSPGAAAAGAGAVLVSVRDHAQAVQALFDGQGEAAVPRGAQVIMTSTIGVDAIADLARRLDAAGARTVDAPVSGGPRRAREGDLLVMAAGAAEDLDAVAPVLAALSPSPLAAGPRVGDGQLLKTINQLLAGVHIAAAAEALALASRAGLDPHVVIEALAGGAGGSFMFSDRGPRMAQVLDAEAPPVRSRVSIFVKDMGLVEALAAASDVDVPLASAAGGQFRRAAAGGLADADDSALVRLVAESTADGSR